jgi:hypothetical protein
MKPDQEMLIANWKAEEQQPFIGWDFSYLDGRMLEGQAPWSYTTRAAELMDQSTSVVDLDTGGGERFLKLHEYWPPKVVATESYPPNFKLASERLTPFGAQVLDIEIGDFAPMPFADNEFDLVLNRHASETGQLYGSIKARDIAAELTAKGLQTPASAVMVGESIKIIGEHKVRVALHPEVIVELPVKIERQSL